MADGSTSGTGCKSGASAAGGFVGTIYPSSDSKLKTCILTGNGPVRAISYNDTKNRNNDGFWGFAGGVVGASLTIVLKGSKNNVNDKPIPTASIIASTPFSNPNINPCFLLLAGTK